jgi:hypothetical protein
LLGVAEGTDEKIVVGAGEKVGSLEGSWEGRGLGESEGGIDKVLLGSVDG